MLAARRRRCHHADAQSLRIDYTSGSRSHANVFVRAEEEDEEDELHHRSSVPPDEITRFHFGFQFGFVRSGRRNASATESSSQTGAELRNLVRLWLLDSTTSLSDGGDELCVSVLLENRV